VAHEMAVTARHGSSSGRAEPTRHADIPRTDRRAWLAEHSAETVAQFDAGAATYNHDAGPITSTQREFVGRLIASTPPGGRILDAAAGTGRYFGMVLASGRQVVGVDASRGMLVQARARYASVPLYGRDLLGLAFDGEFDAVMCTDALEFVPPEHWPTVLANLHRAVRPGGLLYLTVAQFCEDCKVEAFEEARAAGLPVVPGEYVEGRYHFFPPARWVADRLAAEGLEIVAEARSVEGDYNEDHLLLRARSASFQAPLGPRQGPEAR
jgi:SAM-dependent methyltransferase